MNLVNGAFSISKLKGIDFKNINKTILIVGDKHTLDSNCHSEYKVDNFILDTINNSITPIELLVEIDAVSKNPLRKSDWNDNINNIMITTELVIKDGFKNLEFADIRFKLLDFVSLANLLCSIEYKNEKFIDRYYNEINFNVLYDHIRNFDRIFQIIGINECLYEENELTQIVRYFLNDVKTKLLSVEEINLIKKYNIYKNDMHNIFEKYMYYFSSIMDLYILIKIFSSYNKKFLIYVGEFHAVNIKKYLLHFNFKEEINNTSNDKCIKIDKDIIN